MAAPAALGAPASAVAELTSPVRSGTTSSYTFTLTPNSGQIGSFNLTAASGWKILTIDSAPSGVALATGSTTLIQGRGLSVMSSSPLTVRFTAQAPCFSANTTWSLVAKTGNGFTGSSVSVNQPATELAGTCSAAFVTGEAPTDAAFNGNGNGPSENITSVRFSPTGAPIRVLVMDAGEPRSPRPGITVTLQLTSGPGGDLSGPLTAVSDGQGIATFQGSATNPIAIDEIGRGYVITPTAAGVSSTPSAPFGIYQEGTPCLTGPTCTVRGRGNVDGIIADVTAPTGGALGAYVSADEGLMCDGFTALSEEVVVWLYTGEGSQTIEVFVPKSVMRRVLDRGSDHLEFCFEPDPGKSFTDKFGVLRTTPGLLSDCNTGIDPDNCIVSETAVAGGGRLVTVRVKDGRGKL